MKTFIFLFVIAASLPADAQRVRENIRQKVEIMDQNSKVDNKQLSRKASRQSKKELKAQRVGVAQPE